MDFPRKIVVAQPKVIISPSVDGLVADALQVINTEIIKFATKTKSGRSLDLAEARVLQGYIKCLVELSRESRERDRAEDLSSLTDSELADLALKMLKDKPGK